MKEETGFGRLVIATWAIILSCPAAGCSDSSSDDTADTGTTDAAEEDAAEEPAGDTGIDVTQEETDVSEDIFDADEEENVPQSGTISGEITFAGTPPDNGHVLVVIYWSYPAMGPPAGSDGYFEPGDDRTVIPYAIEEVIFGTYAYAAVLWLDPEDPDMMTKYHDISTADPENPREVAVTPESLDVTLDFTADWSKL